MINISNDFMGVILMISWTMMLGIGGFKMLLSWRARKNKNADRQSAGVHI